MLAYWQGKWSVNCYLHTNFAHMGDTNPLSVSDELHMDLYKNNPLS